MNLLPSCAYFHTGSCRSVSYIAILPSWHRFLLITYIAPETVTHIYHISCFNPLITWPPISALKGSLINSYAVSSVL
jgi:hypothetical protein